MCRRKEAKKKNKKPLNINLSKGHEIVKMNPCPKDTFIWSKKETRTPKLSYLSHETWFTRSSVQENVDNQRRCSSKPWSGEISL